MQTAAVPSLTGIVGQLIERLVVAVGFFAGMPQGWGIGTLMEGRVRRLAARFARLAARIEAGTLRPPRRRAERTGQAAERVRRPPLPLVLRRFGWLGRMVPGAWTCALEFEPVLAGPEMAALVAAVPQAARILRPLSHMLGLKAPAYLRLPRRKRKQASAPGARRSSPLPSPRRGEGEGKNTPRLGPDPRALWPDYQEMVERTRRWPGSEPVNPPLLPLGFATGPPVAENFKKPG